MRRFDPYALFDRRTSHARDRSTRADFTRA
jgi:hypothetical protein